MKIAINITRQQLEALTRVVEDDPDTGGDDDVEAAGLVKRLAKALQRAEQRRTSTTLPTYTIRASETDLVLFEGPARGPKDALDRMAMDQGYSDHDDALTQSGGEVMTVKFLRDNKPVRVEQWLIPNDCATAAEDRE